LVGRLGLLAVVVLAAVTVANCGSSGSSSKPSASSSATGSASRGLGATAVTDYLQYTGGVAGEAKARLPAVTIGWLNQQGGTQEIGPLATAGAEMAVKYVNSQLGGVDRHPVVLKECFVRVAEEEGTTCAQEMLADKSMDVIDEGAVGIGVQAFYSTLAGAKPVIVGVAVTPVDGIQKNAAIYFGDSVHVLGPLGTYAKVVLHARSVSIIYANLAGAVPGIQAEAAAVRQEGIPVKLVAYDESDPDLIGPLTIAGASSAGMIITNSDASGCVNVANALAELGITDPKKIVSNPLCLSSQVLKGLGDFPKWTYSIASSLYGDLSDPSEVAYHKVAAQYLSSAVAGDPWAEVAFSQILTTVRFLNELGYGHITPSAILAKMKGFTGPIPLGAPSLQCGKYPSAPAVCNDRAQFYSYEGHGKFVKAAGWLQSP
jgi:branched-chain amino acid transport system substrate-binding protein